MLSLPSTGATLRPRPTGRDRPGAPAARSAVRALRRSSSNRRALPDFLIIGAMKSGTTSLHSWLTASADIRRGVEKEVHFFDHHHARGEAWYRSSFPIARPGSVCGESSPYYLLHPRVPERVAETMPDVRLVAVLRHPIDRAYSHFQHSRSLGHETEPDFVRALELEAWRTDAAWARLEHGSVREREVEQFSYVRRGRYLEQVLRWEEHFPAESLLVLTTDDLQRDPAAAVDAVRRHVGLTAPASATGRLEQLNSRTYDDMDPAARAFLADALAEDVVGLEKHLGRRLGWRL